MNEEQEFWSAVSLVWNLKSINEKKIEPKNLRNAVKIYFFLNNAFLAVPRGDRIEIRIWKKEFIHSLFKEIELEKQWKKKV